MKINLEKNCLLCNVYIAYMVKFNYNKCESFQGIINDIIDL